ncbi:MAG: DUF4268 domain-containing protein [Bdellovibrionota bacterium]
MIGKLKKHDIRKIWKNEASDFTSWLETNLEALSEAIGFELTLVKREHQVGSFSADIVATDESGHKVIIENQLEKTDHTHLGQIITYVSNLDGKTVVWISSEPRQEHINAVNWLNTQTNLEFFLVKLEALSVDDSKPAPLFQVICRPDEGIKTAAAADSELTDRGRFNIQFWTEINKKCEGKLPGFVSRKPLKYHFHSQASGKGGLSFVFLAASKYYGIELYIDTNDADMNESILKQLISQKKKIESEFGHELVFQDLPGKRACRIRYIIAEGDDVMDLDKEKVQDALIDNMVKFERALKPRLKDLDYEIADAA